MEDLHPNTVAFLPCLGILDCEGRGIKTKVVELVACNHLVADIVCDMLPCLVNFRTIADELSFLGGGCDVIADAVEGSY